MDTPFTPRACGAGGITRGSGCFVDVLCFGHYEDPCQVLVLCSLESFH